jgi:uncharacterized DUF497 family protein
MQLEFEWDEEKAAENHLKHGIIFADATLVFTDPFAIEREDDRLDYREERFNMTGMSRNRLLVVTYTMRADRVRIISARGAEPNERRSYHEDSH